MRFAVAAFLYKRHFISTASNSERSLVLICLKCNLHCLGSAAGVVVSCKIPILATRVRFPGGANDFFFILNLKYLVHCISSLKNYGYFLSLFSLLSIRKEFLSYSYLQFCLRGSVCVKSKRGKTKTLSRGSPIACYVITVVCIQNVHHQSCIISCFI